MNKEGGYDEAVLSVKKVKNAEMKNRQECGARGPRGAALVKNGSCFYS